jgi:ABC-2 type transport system ATP-binding protein
MAIIETENLWKSFRVRRRTVEAVRGINLSVNKGEMFAFLGPNGAGKSTTLRMLTTLLPPDKGRAVVAGYDVKRNPNSVRSSIGYVCQSGGLDAMMTGRENIMLQARCYNLPTAQVRKRVAELIEGLDMMAFADRLVRTYSGGQRRRLDLALGLVHQPEVLFLDEPSIGLDPQSRATLWEAVRKLHTAGTTIFLTTHYLDEADQLCDRLAIINDGQIVAEGTPAQLKQQVAGDVITLSIREENEASARARALLQEQAFVRELHEIRATQAQEQRLKVYVERGEESLIAVLHLLEEAGLHVQSVALARPSLDDVFLRIMGRSFEETADKPASTFTYSHA